MKTREEDIIARAALTLLARAPFALPSCAALAKETGLPASRLKRLLKDEGPDLIALIVAFVSRSTSCEEDPDATLQDRLFDFLMSRLEAMRPHKDGFIALEALGRRTPALMLALAKALRRSFASFSPSGPLLLPAYALAFYTWTHDETPDLRRTMATLNLCLKKIFPA